MLYGDAGRILAYIAYRADSICRHSCSKQRQIDIETAQLTIAYSTSWVALVERGNGTLVVLGAAGGCGSAAAQLGNALGAKVIAIVGNSDKAHFCKILGADETISYREDSFVDVSD